MGEDVNAPVDPAAEAELSIEEFIDRGNARDRGEEVEAAPPAPEPAAAAGPAAGDPKKLDSKHARPGRKQSIQAEIDALTTTKHATRKEVEATQAELTRLRGELQTLKTPPAAPPAAPAPAASRPALAMSPNDPEPRLEEFAQEADPYTAYARATARWEARQEHQRIQVGQRAQLTYRSRTKGLTDKLASYEETHPGFSAALHPEVVNVKFTTPRELGTPLGDLIVDSPHTAAILDYFSRDLDSFRRLATLHPLLQARAIGMIESRFEAAASGPSVKPPPISKAKPPNKPVGSSPVVSDESDDDANLPIEEFIRRGNSRDARSSARR
jgi:hypothetical protein